MQTESIQLPFIANMTLRPLSPEIGADVDGIRLADFVDQPGFIAAIRDALGKYLVLRFRGQALEPGEIECFIRALGPPMDIRSVKGARHVPGYDYIQVLSSGLDEQGRKLGDDNTSAQIWHTDAGQWEVPPGPVILYGRVVPDPAPKTAAKNMIKVYESLPDALKQSISGLSAIHHMYPRSVDIEVHRKGASLPFEKRSQGPAHPLVRRHLPTGKAALYLPTRRDSVISGLSDQEGRVLLTQLWEFVDAAPFWSDATMVGDLVLMDNTAVVHSREGWPETERRDMWHLLAEGDRPAPMFPRKTVNANVPAPATT